MIKQIDKLCVPLARRLIDAISVIESGGAAIALVVDAEGKLAGILTDGDIRRAILKGFGLDSPLEPHVNRKFTFVGPEADRAEVLDLMQAMVVNQIPVVDKARKLIGLHRLHQIIGAQERPNWAVIMAGGRGSRLGSITDNIPKPMVRVAGRPILERLILHLVGFGIRRIYLSVNYLGHKIIEHFDDGSKFACRIEYLRETEPLGTGGALSLLPQRPSDSLVVLNGDLVTQANIGEMLEFHKNGAYMATMAVRAYIHQVPFGCVELEGDRILHLKEKPLVERTVNAGIYVFEPALIARVPSYSYPITSLFAECLEKAEAVGAFEIREDWLDVGHRDQLRHAQDGP